MSIDTDTLKLIQKINSDYNETLEHKSFKDRPGYKEGLYDSAFKTGFENFGKALSFEIIDSLSLPLKAGAMVAIFKDTETFPKERYAFYHDFYLVHKPLLFKVLSEHQEKTKGPDLYAAYIGGLVRTLLSTEVKLNYLDTIRMVPTMENINTLGIRELKYFLLNAVNIGTLVAQKTESSNSKNSNTCIFQLMSLELIEPYIKHLRIWPEVKKTLAWAISLGSDINQELMESTILNAQRTLNATKEIEPSINTTELKPA